MARQVEGFNIDQARQAFENAAEQLRETQEQKLSSIAVYENQANSSDFLESSRRKRAYRAENLNRFDWNSFTGGRLEEIDVDSRPEWPVTVSRQVKANPVRFRQEVARTFGSISRSVEEQLQRNDEAGVTTRFKTLVVGGGPHASIYTSVNGPIMREDMLVVFEQQTPGSIWTGSDWFLNSTAYNQFERPVKDVNLPLVGNASPVIAWGEQGVQISNLVDPYDTYIVECDDGYRNYPPGYALGDAVQINMLANVKNILGNTFVTIPASQTFEFGKPVKVWLSVAGKNVYEIEVDEVKLFPGAGQDKPAISEEMRPYWDQQRVVWQERISEFIASPELQKKRIELPKLLTLNIVTEARNLWRLYQKANPKLDPFTPIRECEELAVIGLNDGGRVTLEELFYLTPDTRFVDLPRRIYPVEIATYGTLPEDVRTRYERVVRVARERCVNLGSRGTVVELDARQDKLVVENEFEERRTFDYVISQTGIERSNDYSVFYPSDKDVVARNNNDRSYFPNTLPDVDAFRNVRTRRRVVPGVSVMGPGAGIAVQQFTEPLDRLLKRLEIGENTLALWAVGWLTAWGAYSDAQEYLSEKIAQQVRTYDEREYFRDLILDDRERTQRIGDLFRFKKNKRS